MANHLVLFALIIFSLVVVGPTFVHAQPVQDQLDSGMLLSANKKKNKKKRKGKKKGKKAEASQDFPADDMGSSAPDAAFKKFGVKVGGGYVNSSTVSDLADALVAAGGTAEAGFAYALMGTFNYYISPSLFAFGEFAYASFPLTILNPFTNEEIVTTFSLMHFGAGAGYQLMFGSSMGLGLGGSLGYSLTSASGSNSNSDGSEGEESSDSGSGFSLSFFATPFYAVTPGIRLGLEPRIIYSMATEEPAEGADPATEEEDEGFGLAIAILLTAEFLF